MWDWDWWRSRQGDRVAARLARKAAPGDIIVIHDGHHKNPTADRRYAAETIRILVPRLRQRGYTFECLCEPGRPSAAAAQAMIPAPVSVSGVR